MKPAWFYFFFYCAILIFHWKFLSHYLKEFPYLYAHYGLLVMISMISLMACLKGPFTRLSQQAHDMLWWALSFWAVLMWCILWYLQLGIGNTVVGALSITDILVPLFPSPANQLSRMICLFFWYMQFFPFLFGSLS